MLLPLPAMPRTKASSAQSDKLRAKQGSRSFPTALRAFLATTHALPGPLSSSEQFVSGAGRSQSLR